MSPAPGVRDVESAYAGLAGLSQFEPGVLHPGAG